MNAATVVTKNTHGELVITSLQIASEYNKRHDNVLRSIRHYIQDVALEYLALLKIEETVFIDKNGDYQPMFELSETAALMVTGRFTGKEAAIHQLRIAKQFIAMRDYIRSIEDNKLKATIDDLLETRKRLACVGIHEDSPKAVFELNDNSEVHKKKESWAELGYLTKTVVILHKTIYNVTEAGSEFFYSKNQHIRIKKDAHRGLKLITHAFSIGRYGQADMFIEN